MKLVSIITTAIIVCAGSIFLSNIPLFGNESESRYGYLYIGTTGADTSNGLCLRTYIVKRPKELQLVPPTTPSIYFGDVDANWKFWIFNVGNFPTAQNAGDSIMVLIDWEENSGTINHRGYYAVMNDTSVAGFQSVWPCDTCTLRVMPTPDTVSYGQAWLVWNKPVQDAGVPVTNNILGYNIYRSRKSVVGPAGLGINFPEQLNSTLITDTTYSDNTIPGGDTSYYAYKIVYRPDTVGTAVSNGYESRFLSPNSPKAWLPPAQIELSSFTGYSSNGIVFITWRTESEDGNFAWRVDRSLEPESGFETIYYEKDNEPTTPKPTEYSFVDKNVSIGKTYYYKLADIDMEGRVTWHNTISVTVTGQNLSVKPICYPNPFNQSTSIKYAITNAGIVVLKIIDLRGRIVSILFNEYQKEGIYTKYWDGTNLMNDEVPKGIYFFKLDTPSKSYTGKLVRF